MKTIESLPLDGANGVRIEILERSDTTLVIRWVEPGRCHYGEQRWQGARFGGVMQCLSRLSGRRLLMLPL
jgi:hypothetical protein